MPARPRSTTRSSGSCPRRARRVPQRRRDPLRAHAPLPRRPDRARRGAAARALAGRRPGRRSRAPRRHPARLPGGAGPGRSARLPLHERFHWLVAPRSTIIQTSAVHSGLCDDPARELARLVDGWFACPRLSAGAASAVRASALTPNPRPAISPNTTMGRPRRDPRVANQKSAAIRSGQPAGAQRAARSASRPGAGRSVPPRQHNVAISYDPWLCKTPTGPPVETRIGHVHLKVADVDRAGRRSTRDLDGVFEPPVPPRHRPPLLSARRLPPPHRPEHLGEPGRLAAARRAQQAYTTSRSTTPPAATWPPPHAPA